MLLILSKTLLKLGKLSFKTNQHVRWQATAPGAQLPSVGGRQRLGPRALLKLPTRAVEIRPRAFEACGETKKGALGGILGGWGWWWYLDISLKVTFYLFEQAFIQTK